MKQKYPKKIRLLYISIGMMIMICNTILFIFQHEQRILLLEEGGGYYSTMNNRQNNDINSNDISYLYHHLPPLPPSSSFDSTSSTSSLRPRPRIRRRRHQRRLDKVTSIESSRNYNDSPSLSTTTTTSNRIIYYSQNRHDRSGAVVHDMLWVHAYAYKMGGIYGGSCGDHIFTYQNVTQQLLIELGWDIALKYACPTNYTNSSSEIIVNRDFYADLDATIFTPEWIEYFQQQIRDTTTNSNKLPSSSSSSSSTSLISLSSRPSSSNIIRNNNINNNNNNHHNHQNEPFIIAVHIRRGDVDPCTYMNRYMPNEYYLSIIQEYLPPLDIYPNIIVNIYSESDTYESFDIFTQQKQYKANLLLDVPLANVWRALSTANIAILSKSSFSYVPAIINPNIVVYTTYRHHPLSSWNIVDIKKSDHARHIVKMIHDNNCDIQNGDSSDSIMMKKYQYTNHNRNHHMKALIQ